MTKFLVRPRQCDQMANLFFNHMTIHNKKCAKKFTKFAQKYPKFAKSTYKIVPNTKKAHKILTNYFKTLPKWRNFAKSGPTSPRPR